MPFKPFVFQTIIKSLVVNGGLMEGRRSQCLGPAVVEITKSIHFEQTALFRFVRMSCSSANASHSCHILELNYQNPLPTNYF